MMKIEAILLDGNIMYATLSINHKSENLVYFHCNATEHFFVDSIIQNEEKDGVWFYTRLNGKLLSKINSRYVIQVFY